MYRNSWNYSVPSEPAYFGFLNDVERPKTRPPSSAALFAPSLSPGFSRFQYLFALHSGSHELLILLLLLCRALPAVDVCVMYVLFIFLFFLTFGCNYLGI